MPLADWPHAVPSEGDGVGMWDLDANGVLDADTESGSGAKADGELEGVDDDTASIEGLMVGLAL